MIGGQIRKPGAHHRCLEHGRFGDRGRGQVSTPAPATDPQSFGIGDSAIDHRLRAIDQIPNLTAADIAWSAC